MLLYYIEILVLIFEPIVRKSSQLKALRVTMLIQYKLKVKVLVCFTKIEASFLLSKSMIVASQR